MALIAPGPDEISTTYHHSAYTTEHCDETHTLDPARGITLLETFQQGTLLEPHSPDSCSRRRDGLVVLRFLLKPDGILSHPVGLGQIGMGETERGSEPAQSLERLSGSVRSQSDRRRFVHCADSL